MAVYCTSAVLSVCTVLRLTTFFQRTWGCQDSSQIDKSRTGRAWWRGFEERERELQHAEQPWVSTQCGGPPQLEATRVRMVHHEPAWPAVHGLLRPQGPLQDPPQTPPAPAAAGDCPHKVGHTIMHPLHVISYFSLACLLFNFWNFSYSRKLLCLGFIFLHRRLFTAPKYSGIMGWTSSIWGLKYLSIGFTQVQTDEQLL